jgi:hypothetical protein
VATAQVSLRFIGAFAKSTTASGQPRIAPPVMTRHRDDRRTRFIRFFVGRTSTISDHFKRFQIAG